MSERSDDIKATAEDLVLAAERLRSIEEAKLRLPDDDPQVVPLSKQAAQLAQDIARETRLELEIAIGADRATA